ncbi:MAG: alpha/beta hydrolase [Candidatus Paceibacterota bacterium]
MPFITFDQSKIYYEVYGEGKPILFLHGWNESIESFKHNLLKKFGAEHCFILVDLPGCGMSEKIRLSFNGLSEMIDMLLNRLEIRKVSIMGYCMGGIIGLDYAIKRQERVDRLFLLETFIDFPYILRPLLMKRFGYKILELFLINRAGFYITKKIIFLKGHKYREGYFKILKGSDLYTSIEYIELMWNYSKINHYKKMNELMINTMIVSGKYTNKTYMRMIKKVRENIPKSTFFQLDRAGHFPIEENSEGLVNIMRAF